MWKRDWWDSSDTTSEFLVILLGVWFVLLTILVGPTKHKTINHQSYLIAHHRHGNLQADYKQSEANA
jgi:hypothetical protein